MRDHWGVARGIGSSTTGQLQSGSCTTVRSSGWLAQEAAVWLPLLRLLLFGGELTHRLPENPILCVEIIVCLRRTVSQAEFSTLLAYLRRGVELRWQLQRLWVSLQQRGV